MSHDTTEPHGEGTMGSRPSQGVFIGRLALCLLAVMAVFALVMFTAGLRG